MTLADRLSVWALLALMAFAWVAPWFYRWRAARKAAREWREGLAHAVTDHERRMQEIERAARDLRGSDQRDPGDENDQVAEGLGIVRPPRRPPRCVRAYPSRTTPLELLPKDERELWREALKASL